MPKFYLQKKVTNNNILNYLQQKKVEKKEQLLHLQTEDICK